MTDEDELEIWRAGPRTGAGGVVPAAPAIVLHEPKFPHNVAQVVRLACAFGERPDGQDARSERPEVRDRRPKRH
jgi:hypothetical protein